jgi:hypothetical protein
VIAPDDPITVDGEAPPNRRMSWEALMDVKFTVSELGRIPNAIVSAEVAGPRNGCTEMTNPAVDEDCVREGETLWVDDIEAVADSVVVTDTTCNHENKKKKTGDKRYELYNVIDATISFHLRCRH